jgi:AraC family transcriptional regulator
MSEAANPVAKATWFIESHSVQELTLDEIAAAAGISKYHLSRLFGLATGNSVMRYLRGRRLSEAARSLASGAPDILALALDSGYGSHEAFTRAFRDWFGLTPESVRAQGNTKGLEIMSAIKMDESLLTELEAPRLENGRTILIAGLSERYESERCAAIPAQWQRFGPHIGHIPGQIGNCAYGVVYNGDSSGNIEYLTGIEVGDFSSLPPEFTRLRIAPQRYAVFTHRGHVTEIRRTWFTILSKWLPESGYQATEGPEFERYGPEFNPVTGNGGFEIWIPLK